MKVGIHHRKGSFSDQWIRYCEVNAIAFKIVDCYRSDIVRQLDDCDALMWHHHHKNYKDALCAKEILFSLEQSGKVVFPSFNSGWHFDDKVGQKYLLESINAPLVPSYVFYDRNKALEWAAKTVYPKVFKLRRGAGATNVKLVKSFAESKKLINQAFNSGFKQYDSWSGFKEIAGKYRRGTATLRNLIGGIVRIFKPRRFEAIAPKEKGYVYFQEFIPNNSNDIRLIVIGGRYAYGMKRMNRENDFRASGSSKFVYDNIPLEVVEEAFLNANRLKLQSVAFDFIFDGKNKPLIIELSYGFGTVGSGKCPGYWTSDLKWHQESFNPYGWMVEGLRESIEKLRL